MFDNPKLFKDNSVSIDIGFSTNVLAHPKNHTLDQADLPECLRYLGKRFHYVEIELSEAVGDLILGADAPSYDNVVEGIKSAATEAGLCLSVHASWFGPYTDLAAENEAERSGAIDLLIRNARFATDVGARALSFHPGKDHGQRENTLTRVARSIEQAMVRSNTQVPFCLENMGSDRPGILILNDDEHCKLNQQTGVRMALDVIHLRSTSLNETRFFESLEAVAPLVGNIHLADMKAGSHAHLPIGDGDLPITSVLSILSKHGYHQAAIVEEFVRNRPFDLFVDRAVTYREALKQDKM